MLVEDGYAALKLTQVAARAQAHRTDVYRRWPTKARLVTDALAEFLLPVPDLDTGSLYTDLRAFADELSEAWNLPWSDGLLGLLADLRHDADAETAFRRLGALRSQPLKDAVARAVRRGEAQEVPELAADLLEGPLMHRHVFGRRPLSPDELDVVVRSVHRLLTETEVRR